MKAPVKVAICVPSQDSIKAKTAVSIAALVHYSLNQGLMVVVLNLEGATVSKARNNLVRQAIDWDCDYLFFYDSDMLVPPDTIVRLVNHDKDIVCVTYNKRSPPYETLGHLLGPERDVSKGGLFEASFMPGGAMMIKAAVVKKLGYPWFFETYFWDGVSPVASFIKMISDWSIVDLPLSVRATIAESPSFVEWLEANELAKLQYRDDVSMVSEDYNFCIRARRAGYQIWCDMDLTFQTGHIGNQVVTCIPAPAEEHVDA
jgi:cellulose synthase/poly-beta-1,6-N-acetylglucosamine synthase-like glycosyltransferase